MIDKATSRLPLIFTMDCVPPEGPDAVSGPESWDAACQSIRAFSDKLQQLEVKGTFFIEPTMLDHLGEDIENLHNQNMETGLLCHPQLHEYKSCLGSYSFDRQREIIRLVTQIWKNVLSDHPQTFRPGFFSANDYTYQVLCMENYQQGSCSLPGRVDMDQCCDWNGAFPFPHHTDPLDRKLAGTMELFEVPVSSDFETRSNPGVEMYTPPHLRIESPCINEHADQLIDNTLRRMDEEETSLRSLTFVTHNAVCWGDSEDPHCERLTNMVNLVKESCERHGLTPIPSTITDLHNFADELGQDNQPMGSLE